MTDPTVLAEMNTALCTLQNAWTLLAQENRVSDEQCRAYTFELIRQGEMVDRLQRIDSYTREDALADKADMVLSEPPFSGRW